MFPRISAVIEKLGRNALDYFAIVIFEGQPDIRRTKGPCGLTHLLKNKGIRAVGTIVSCDLIWEHKVERTTPKSANQKVSTNDQNNHNGEC